MYIDIHTHASTHDPGLTEVKVLDTGLPLAMTLSEPGLFCYGAHPWTAHEIDQEAFFENLKCCMQRPNFFALGEIGLDRARKETWEVQRILFERQLEFAQTFKLKRIVIHCVRAYSDILAPLKNLSYAPTVILHDYNGNPETTKAFENSLDCRFSFGTRLFDMNSKAVKSFKDLDLKQVFFETDDQVEKRIMDVYRQAAQIKNVSLESLQRQMEENFQTLLEGS